MSLKPAEREYWDLYVSGLPEGERPSAPFVTASYAGTPEITDGLLELYLAGKKTAGSSLVEDFLTAGDPLPAVGNYWIYLNSAGLPSCILRTERIETHNFQEVPARIAMAEGEGDLSLEYWRRVHEELYRPFFKTWGLERIEDATVVTEFFRIVFRF